MNFTYLARYVRHDLFRMSLFWQRDADGYFATGQQSGSHWISNLMASAICIQYGVPKLEHIRDKSLIGHPRMEQKHADLPRLVRTHHAPSPLIHSVPVRSLVKFPKYVVVLRDIRASIVSRFERQTEELAGISFSESLRDHSLWDRGTKWDLYKRFVFFNAWGDVSRKMPDQTLLLHYENLRRDTAGELERVWRFLDLPVSNPAMFAQAAADCSKDKMAEKDPHLRNIVLVRRDERDPVDWFNAEDREYFSSRCAELLRHTFGYDFNDWSSAKKPPKSNANAQQTAVARAA
jgi:hypothetical protein